MLRKLTRLSFACIVAASLCGWAVAHEHDHGGARSAIEYGYHNGYMDGFQHGREDRRAQVGYDFNSRDYHRAKNGYESYMGNKGQYKNGYRDGYVAGYDDGFYGRISRFSGPDAQAHYGSESYENGAGPGYGSHSVAFQVGYKDGLIQGGKDRRHNKDFRPEKCDRYEDADHGYRDDYGRKRDYKRQYREGYMAGYQRGYGEFQGAWNR